MNPIAAISNGWSKLSLTTKGVIFLAVPLFWQLSFGILLLQMHQQADLEAQKAMEARAIATEANKLTTNVIQAYRVSQEGAKDQNYEGYRNYLSPKYTAILHNMQSNYDNLLALTKNAPELNRTVKLSYQPVSEGIALIEQARKDILAGNIDKMRLTRSEMQKRFSSLGHAFISREVLVLAKNEAASADASNEKQAELRRRTVKYAFILILADIAFFILLAQFLIKSMTSRLHLMADNAMRIAAHQPLHPPLPGDDEIAQLDRTFHNMAQSIEESKQIKQELYNMVTHDMRTPLSAIQGCLEMLIYQQGAEISVPNKKIIKKAIRNSTRTMALVNDLLDSQKMEAGLLELNAEAVYLEDVFEGVETEIAGWLDERGVEINFVATNIKVMANRDMLHRIIFNLVSQALKSAPRGSVIAVGVEPSATMAEITVSDQGPAIPRHMLKNMFILFRADSVVERGFREGSGLALSVCQDFVQLHGGKIWATSKGETGNVYHFTMPI